VPVLVISEEYVRLQFSAVVVEFFCIAKRPNDLAANRLSRGCVLRDALGHVPLPVKKEMDDFALKTAIDSLAELRAVSIRVELAFGAPDMTRVGPPG
jgi:hypothetical protein